MFSAPPPDTQLSARLLPLNVAIGAELRVISDERTTDLDNASSLRRIFTFTTVGGSYEGGAPEGREPSRSLACC